MFTWIDSNYKRLVVIMLLIITFCSLVEAENIVYTYNDGMDYITVIKKPEQKWTLRKEDGTSKEIYTDCYMMTSVYSGIASGFDLTQYGKNKSKVQKKFEELEREYIQGNKYITQTIIQ